MAAIDIVAKVSSVRTTTTSCQSRPCQNLYCNQGTPSSKIFGTGQRPECSASGKKHMVQKRAALMGRDLFSLLAADH